MIPEPRRYRKAGGVIRLAGDLFRLDPAAHASQFNKEAGRGILKVWTGHVEAITKVITEVIQMIADREVGPPQLGAVPRKGR